MSGTSNSTYQIPNNPGQPPAFTAFGVSTFDSSLLNERQNEFNQFNVLAYQKSADDIDYQLSYFNRYSQLHFMPDTIGDLVFNGVASDVYRHSFVNGIQEDTACRVGYAHTLRFGFSASAERTLVNNASVAVAGRCHRRRRSMRHSRSSIQAPRPAGCSAPTCRTNGRSPTS